MHLGAYKAKMREVFCTKSGIHSDLFEQIKFTNDTKEIQSLLGWKKPPKEGACAAILENEDGSIWQLVITDSKDSRGYKYMAPKEAGNIVFTPPIPQSVRQIISDRHGIEVPMEGSFWDWFKDHPEIDLSESEGAKKALAGLSNGFVVVSGYGCKCLKSEHLVPYLSDRNVIIALDRDDCLTKPDAVADVYQGTEAGTKFAFKHGAKSVAVAEWNSDQGKGLDDLLVQSGLPALEKALNSAVAQVNRWEEDSDRSEEKQDKEDEGKRPPCIFEELMTIAQDCQFFVDDQDTAYADVLIEGVRQTYQLRTKNFKGWIAYELFKRTERAANSDAMMQAIQVLEYQAKEVKRPVFMRTGEFDGKKYLDLSNEQNQAIEISTTGWRVLESQDVPVRFVRSPTQLPMATPLEGGSLDLLWELIPVAEKSQLLLLTWLISCLVPTGSKPILVLTAPKGSGKSTTARILKALIDNTKASLLPSVGDRHKLAVQSRHQWIFVYDNLSSISIEEQNALCCTATGAGFLTRQLFTDSEAICTEYLRPQILTGVDLVPTRSDLLDRCLLIELNRITDDDRLTEKQLNLKLAEYQGLILGCLLTALSQGLANLPNVDEPLKRLADYSELAIASEQSLGYKKGDFILAFSNNDTLAKDEAVGASPIAAAILEVLEESSFSGTVTELLTKLKFKSDDRAVQKLSAISLGRQLRGVLKADLEAVGISVDYLNNNKKELVLSRPVRGVKNPSQPSQSTQPIPSKDSSCDGSKNDPSHPATNPSQFFEIEQISDGCTKVQGQSVTNPSQVKALSSMTRAGSEGCDGLKQPLTGQQTQNIDQQLSPNWQETGETLDDAVDIDEGDGDV
jgi:energy-coupling factor transporter ATP-binding protein EcfA2